MSDDVVFKKGNLVLYKSIPAIISACDEKFTIVFLTGPKKTISEQKVRAKDIMLLYASLLTEKDIHKVYSEQNNQKVSAQSFEEVWNLYEAECKTAIPFSDLADLLISDFSADSAWNIYQQIKVSAFFEDISVSGSFVCFVAREKDAVQKMQEKIEGKEKDAQIRLEFLARLKSKTLRLPQDMQFMQEVEALALGKTDKSKILREIGRPETPETAHAILLETGIWSMYKNPYPSRWGLSMNSAQEVLETPLEEERHLLSTLAYAIDNAWSEDPDDAVAFDGEFLWVHIADPASTVSPDSTIDRAARNRGATLYLPEGAARMLCEKSLEDYALGLSNPSRSLSFKIKLDESGAVVDCEVIKSLVNVTRLTYQQADEKKNEPSLLPLFNLARRNIERRKQNDGVFIELPEIHLAVKMQDQQANIHIATIVQTESAQMVREMMLLAGEAAAKFAFKNGIPFPFISQETPDIPKILPEGLAGQYRLRRSMRSRSVGVHPSKHAGLGLGMYSQVTSPLRRYADLVAHQQLRAFIDEKKLLTKDAVLERISAGDAAAGAAVKSERKSVLHWILVYLLQNPTWQAEAVVVDIQNNRMTLLIPSLAQETSITAIKKYQLNDTLQLRAANIDLPKLQVTFVPV